MAGYTGADIYRRMHATPGNVQTVTEAEDAAHTLRDAHHRLAQRIAEIQNKINGYWEGESGEAAAG